MADAGLSRASDRGPAAVAGLRPAVGRRRELIRSPGRVKRYWLGSTGDTDAMAPPGWRPKRSVTPASLSAHGGTNGVGGGISPRMLGPSWLDATGGADNIEYTPAKPGWLWISVPGTAYTVKAMAW